MSTRLDFNILVFIQLATFFLKRAKEILKKVGYNKNIDRICFIIGNHHTPSKIDGLDFQIQWEADLLENLTVMDKEKEQEKMK